MTRFVARVAGAALVAAGVYAAPLAAQTAPIRGFARDQLDRRARLERILRTTPDTARLRQYMLFMSEEPHHAGSARSRIVAEYALGLFHQWGLAAEIETFEALLPIPVAREVELLAPVPYSAQLREPALSADKDSGDEHQLPTYNAYSADGDVTGDLVFVNYGLPEDYDRLARLGIDVRGKVVIAKYGRSWRGIKPKVAAEHGAVACLLYSDPEDDGYYVDDVYPQGPMRPWQGVQRGSVMDMPTYPGDPLTPGWGATPGSRKLPRDEVPTLMRIPVLPLSYGDAQHLLAALGGPVAPNDDWKGALPITYRLGPGPARVRVRLAFDWSVRPIYNVIARIPGATYPDQWVLTGNHHDAWVNGAQDPISGAVGLLETARSFAELLKTGWRPQRTLIFALWDAEEWGLIGSTEWAEAHADELASKAVAYINTDSYERGRLGLSGSHSLETFFREILRDTPQPQGEGSALDALAAHALAEAKTAGDSAKAREWTYRLGALGSGSDYGPFLDHLTIAAAHAGYGGGQEAGIYHSIYDSYTFFTRFLDPGFLFGRSQSGAVGVALLRLLDAPILPFSFTDAADTYRRYATEIDSLATAELGEASVDLETVRSALDRLAAAGAAFDSALAGATARGRSWLERRRADLGSINAEVYLSERDLALEGGVPRRPWYRHAIYAPGFYTGYGVKTMPGIREAVEQGDRAEAAVQAARVAEALERMAARAATAAATLRAITDTP